MYGSIHARNYLLWSSHASNHHRQTRANAYIRFLIYGSIEIVLNLLHTSRTSVIIPEFQTTRPTQKMQTSLYPVGIQDFFLQLYIFYASDFIFAEEKLVG